MTCPNCGYCDKCGRANHPVHPYQTQPYWYPQYPITVWNGIPGNATITWTNNTAAAAPQFTPYTKFQL